MQSRGYSSTRRTRSNVWVPVVLIRITNNGRRMGGGVHVGQYAATLGARRLRYENPRPSNDWVTLPVGDEPENTKDRQKVTWILAVRNQRTNT